MSASTYAILNPGRVIAGAGSIEQLAALAGTDFGARHALVVSDKGVAAAGLVQGPCAALEAAGLRVTLIDSTPPEPDVRDVEAIMEAAHAAGAPDLVVGIGGGSAMDVAKIVAVLLAHKQDLRELLSKKAEIPARGLPTVMVPTTAGTGSEATPNSIILVPEDELKVGIVSARLMPDAVILDPLLTLTLPPAVTASTGMDALTHAIECYCSRKGNPFSDLYALEAIRLIARSIRRAVSDGRDVAAREDMLMGAYWGGVCIATSSTTAVHALAYPLGGKYRMPHGLSNAILLPSVMAFNLVGNEKRFAAMARAMGLDTEGLSDAEAGGAFVEELKRLNADLGVPAHLRGWGIDETHLDGLVEGASKVTRLLDNNPRPMSREDMRALYAALL
ncbi:iron-containing alcohol dehydrogenase [Azohydromonas caseinilytica]|uniref:Iron-containing alcohol dehydrogenase n=1 Tax=Azohydromonas caseinilytica TaxID=2728836 RepID=A0A848FA13_9BURK|nr:iron-containing alcohol dehydrogenase [Azohydromonas caseinilytica]NML15696.1 iron-containing alcohol dehydrogenase [Azohydromonas caseinilytica]